MYAESNVAVKTERQTPLFVNLKESFEKENGIQDEYISRIQGALNNILDRRTLDKDQMKEVPAIPSDFNSAMGMELNHLRNNNSKLERIINHLQEIL